MTQLVSMERPHNNVPKCRHSGPGFKHAGVTDPESRVSAPQLDSGVRRNDDPRDAR